MNAIWLKIKADITSRPAVSTLIVVTIAAASALLTLALATVMNLGGPYDTSFAELNGAHLWLYLDRDIVRRRDVERIASMDGVTESTGLQVGVHSRVRIGNTRVWTSLRATPLGQPAVNRLLLREGRPLAPHQAEVLAAVDLQDLYELRTGDTVEVARWDGRAVPLPVIGLAYNPTWDTYRNSQPPYLYVTEETLRQLYPDDEEWDWSIGLRLADPEAVGAALAQAEDLLRDGEQAIIGHTDWRDVRRSALFGARLNFVFLGAFSVFAIVATVLVVTNSIGTTVLSQFRQIGMLKAIGFTQRQTLILYVGQYLALSAAGAPLGLLLGILLSPLPLQSVAASLSTTFKPPANVVLIVLVLVAIPGFVVLATLASAYRGARANIIAAIAVGAEAPRHTSPWPVRLAARARLPTVLVLGLNDVFARPFRSTLTGLNLLLGVVGVVLSLTLNRTLAGYREDPSLLGIVYDARVTRDRTGDARTRALLRRAPGVAGFYAESLVDAETSDGRSFQVRAVEGDLESFPFRISRGRFFQPNTHEVIAGQGLLDWLGLEVGDELTLYLDDQDHPATWRIVGQYPEPVNVGQMLMASLPAVQRAARGVEPRTYYLKLAPNAHTAQLRHYLEPRRDADLSLTLVGQAIPGVVVYLQLAVLGLGVILIGIALVNVFNTSLMSMHERLRAIGVLKTVGMTPAQVMVMVNTTAGFLGFLAAVLGIPLGLVFTRLLLAGLSSAYGFGEVQVRLGWLPVVLLVPLMVGVSMLGSSIPGRRAARLDIVDVLRSE